VYIKDERPRVPTPEPTPTASPAQSVSQHLSPPLTPQLSQAADLVQVPPTQPVLPAAEAAESLTDDAGDFPSYDGRSMWLHYYYFLGCGTLCRTEVPIIIKHSLQPSVGLFVCLSIQCIVAKWLIGYECGFGW